MDAARALGMSTPVRWMWADVTADTENGVTHLRHLADGTTLTVVNGRLRRGPGYPSAPRAVRQGLARVGAIVRLRERGKYYLHASGAVAPDGRAWILTGDTGAGKSTLAFALSRAGWRILGDDGVIIEHSHDGPVAHPWSDPLRVSLKLSGRYPMLGESAQAPADNDERQRVPVRSELGRRARIAGILLLEQSARHIFHRVAGDVALSAVVRQSPWVMLGDAPALDHYRALHRLIEQVPAYRFTHSADQLDTIARTLAEAAWRRACRHMPCAHRSKVVPSYCIWLPSVTSR